MTLIDKISNIFDKVVKNEANINKALSYLVKYGYLSDKKENNIEDIIAAVIKLHKIAGFDSSGIINGKTMSIMELPRCSMQDNVVEEATSLPKWASNNLTYYIGSRDSDMPKEKWDECFRLAFSYWSEITPLVFNQTNSQSEANLIINTGRGRQNDFDGPSGTLAYFELPPYANYKGQLKGMWDADELWTIDGNGILLVNVACHEIGHALGLNHSNISSALMAPYYNRNIAKPQSNDDIPRMQARYGKPVTGTTPTPTPQPVPKPNNPKETIIRLTGDINKIDIEGYRIQKLS